MPDILIKNTKVFFNNYLQPAEVTIEDGKITKIAKDIHVSSVDHVIDAGGALTLPAGIDVHVHFRDPGLTHKEDWYSSSCSAVARRSKCYNINLTCSLAFTEKIMLNRSCVYQNHQH
jgi:dihydroorotase